MAPTCSLALFCAFATVTLASSASPPTIEARGEDYVVTARGDGKVLFNIGEDQVVDLGALAFSVADLRTQLDAALERLDEAGIAQTKTTKDQASAAIRATAMDDKVDVLESDLDVLEGRMVEVASLVANMSDCDKQGLHHDDGGLCARSSSWSCGALTVAGGKASVKGEAFIGTIARVTCDAGTYIDGSEQVTCLGSGAAESGAHWGLPSTGNNHMPKCSKCLAACKTCSDGTSCDTCPKTTDVWSQQQSKCVANKARSCKQLLDWKQLPEIPAGKKFVEAAVELYPDVRKDATLVVKATCHIVKEDHDGKVHAYTSIQCQDLSSSGGQCKPMPMVTSPNTCQEQGYIAGPPRSATHLIRLLTRFPSHVKVVPGVYREAQLNPSYGNCAMADPKVFGNTIQNTCSDWKSVDGGQWFLRDKPMSVVGHNDPDKDYCVGGFLNFWGFWSYKNGRCLDPKVSPSICSANRRELARVNRCSPKCQGTCYTETGRFADAWRKDCKSLSSPDDWFTTNPSGIQMFTKNYKCIANCDGLRLYDTWAGVNGDPNKCATYLKTVAPKTYICSTKDF